MNDSFHYLSMANHMMVQKKLMEQLKDTGLTLGQPKGSGLSERSRWRQSEGNCGRMSDRGRIFNFYFKSNGRKRTDREKNA